MNNVDLEGNLPIPQQRGVCSICNLLSKSSLPIRTGSHRCFEHPEIDPVRCGGTYGNPAAGAKTWRQITAQKTSKSQRAPKKRAPESAKQCQRATESAREPPRAPKSPRELQRASGNARQPQRAPESAREPQRAPESPRERQRSTESAIEPQRTPENAREL